MLYLIGVGAEGVGVQRVVQAHHLLFCARGVRPQNVGRGGVHDGSALVEEDDAVHLRKILLPQLSGYSVTDSAKHSTTLMTAQIERSELDFTNFELLRVYTSLSGHGVLLG